MNKTALKNFATWSRRKLIEQVQTKAFLYGIDEKNGLLMEEQFGQLVINGQTYPLSMKSSFTALQKQLEQKGYKQLLEEVAYTWFNRIIAIRYMEVHEYLPEKVNVLSSSVGRVDPDILFEFDTMDLAIDESKVRELVNTGDTEAAFRLLFVAQCNALNTILPFMFEKIQDYTELLLPDFLLDAESVIKRLVQNEDLTESFEEIEVIGWLYQYYIAEEKDRVFAQKSKYKKEEIPFATQLFTPKWIVQYMVQNSLGRYWTEAHREDEDLIDKWEYFIKHEEEDFHEKIAPYVNKELKVEDIKLLDPAMGSGHILVYAFEVFHEIYEKCGYPEREIPRLILENNLYGLDIDDRAYQLAAFAVVMKAASYSKRFLRSVEREGITLNLASIQETNHVSDEVIAYIAQQEVGQRYNQVKAFFEQYNNAKTYGSLINITEREISYIEERFEQIVNNPVNDLFYGEQHEIAKQVMPTLINQTKIMRIEYDIVVMNPPYMGNRKMNALMSSFVNKNFPDSKGDLFSAFMEVDFYQKENSFYSAINQNSWMFLNSYEDLRNKIIDTKFIDSMLHLGPRAFEEINGEVVQSTTFILRNSNLDNLKGIYIRLIDEKNSVEKKLGFFKAMDENQNLFLVNQNRFRNIPSSNIGYWITDSIEAAFRQGTKLGEIAAPRQGVKTLDNDRFLKYWFEVSRDKIGFGQTSISNALESGAKWFPYNKGGTYLKWYGNNEYVVNWENDGQEMKEFAVEKYNSITRTITNINYFFRKGITWSALTSGSISLRLFNEGYIFDSKGSSMFFEDDVTRLKVLAFLNSSVCSKLLEILSPTLDFNVGPISNLPIIDVEDSEICGLVNENVKIAKESWDDSELSWDFKEHPFIKYSGNSNNLVQSFKNWDKYSKDRRAKLKNNEERINQIFIDSYKIENVNYKVEDSQISINIGNANMDTKTFLSYFIGVLFNRYQIFDFKREINIIEIVEKEYSTNDIIQYLKDFLESLFTSEYTDENFEFIAQSLGQKNGEDAETRIRRYFLDEFFKDHCKMYNNRPIYWLVDSGKQKGLRTLIYMHRYTPSTMATIRFEHLQEIQAKYQQEIADLENRLVNPNLSATDKKKLNAEKVSFEKKIDELREFDKRLAVIAAEEIEIDLDDGVKVNYEKFYRGGKGVLAKIK